MFPSAEERQKAAGRKEALRKRLNLIAMEVADSTKVTDRAELADALLAELRKRLMPGQGD